MSMTLTELKRPLGAGWCRVRWSKKPTGTGNAMVTSPIAAGR